MLKKRAAAGPVASSGQFGLHELPRTELPHGEVRNGAGDVAELLQGCSSGDRGKWTGCVTAGQRERWEGDGKGGIGGFIRNKERQTTRCGC